MILNNGKNILVVGVGDIKIGQSPDIIRTTLGSCIAVCLYDSEKKKGGMLHLMLADSSIHVKNNTNMRRAKYADTGIADLLAMLNKEYNIGTISLKAKIFGGAKILKLMTQNIGQDNEVAVNNILQTEGISIVAKKTGGEKGYQIEFDLETGLVKSKIFGEEPGEY